MTYRIIFGTDTNSIEDASQVVYLDMPDEVGELDSEDLEDYIRENYWELRHQDAIPMDDTMESFALAMQAEGLNEDMISRILTTVADAITNNVFG